jgi:WD40 repeat protein
MAGDVLHSMAIPPNPVIHASWRPQGHRAPVADMAVDASGGLLASGGADRAVRVWDTDGGFCTHVFSGHTCVAAGRMLCGAGTPSSTAIALNACASAMAASSSHNYAMLASARTAWPTCWLIHQLFDMLFSMSVFLAAGRSSAWGPHVLPAYTCS